MDHYPYPSYLRTHRDRWALTQPDLGALLGINRNVISKYERLRRTPSVHTVIGAEFLFGEHPRKIFPALYFTIELGITKRAAEFAERLQHLDDASSVVQRELLEAVARRAAAEPL